MSDELRPRHYAAVCCALPGRAERRAYLAEVVPAHFRDWVRLYVELEFERKEKNSKIIKQGRCNDFTVGKAGVGGGV